MTLFLDSAQQELLVRSYFRAKRRLILLDYDGTLVPFAKNPADALPDVFVRGILERASSDPRNTLAVISGRTKHFLEKHLSMYSVTLIAEHGAFSLRPGQKWTEPDCGSRGWIKKIAVFLDRAVKSCPGSFVEVKETAVVWHYRESEPASAARTAGMIRSEIETGFQQPARFEMIEGNKVIEFMSPGIDKGSAIRNLFALEGYDYLFAMGDDVNDESMFLAMPDRSYTVRIGDGNTSARFRLVRRESALALLERLFACRAD